MPRVLYTPSAQWRVSRREHESVLDAMQSRLEQVPEMMRIHRQTVERNRPGTPSAADLDIQIAIPHQAGKLSVQWPGNDPEGRTRFLRELLK